LLSQGNRRPPKTIPLVVLNITIFAIRALNNIANLDLASFQDLLSQDHQFEVLHVLNFLLQYCSQPEQSLNSGLAAADLSTVDTSITLLNDGTPIRQLLNELILLIGYLCLQNTRNQDMLHWGKSPSLLQRLVGLPFHYLHDQRYKHILLPTLVAGCFENAQNRDLLSEEMNIDLVASYLDEQIIKMANNAESVFADDEGSMRKDFAFSKRFP
jgi:hypothetical protein